MAFSRSISFAALFSAIARPSEAQWQTGVQSSLGDLVSIIHTLSLMAGLSDIQQGDTLFEEKLFRSF
jgi:hypothetical protein